MCTHSVKVLFSISPMIRGYHEYKDLWEATEGEELLCLYENIFMSADMTLKWYNGKQLGGLNKIID